MGAIVRLRCGLALLLLLVSAGLLVGWRLFDSTLLMVLAFIGLAPGGGDLRQFGARVVHGEPAGGRSSKSWLRERYEVMLHELCTAG